MSVAFVFGSVIEIAVMEILALNWMLLIFINTLSGKKLNQNSSEHSDKLKAMMYNNFQTKLSLFFSCCIWDPSSIKQYWYLFPLQKYQSPVQSFFQLCTPKLQQ